MASMQRKSIGKKETPELPVDKMPSGSGFKVRLKAQFVTKWLAGEEEEEEEEEERVINETSKGLREMVEIEKIR